MTALGLPVDFVTKRIEAFLPGRPKRHGKRKAQELHFDNAAMWYRHATRGWKRVSYRRLGVKPMAL